MKTYTKVHELLASPDRWCQGALAKDAYGRIVGPTDQDARKFCLIGAIECVYDSLDLLKSEVYARAYAALTLGNLSLSHFNDTNDHATVLAFCKRHDI